MNEPCSIVLLVIPFKKSRDVWQCTVDLLIMPTKDEPDPHILLSDTGTDRFHNFNK
jgi:hypothetical protein